MQLICPLAITTVPPFLPLLMETESTGKKQQGLLRTSSSQERPNRSPISGKNERERNEGKNPEKETKFRRNLVPVILNKIKQF